MKSPDDVLTRLRSLAKQDRSWILARLSADAKARLLEQPRAAAPSPVRSSPLAEADAARVCQVLRTEPAWVLAAILKIQCWPWQAKLLASLPESTRLEVQRLASVTFTAQMLDSSLRLTQEKVADGSAASRDSKFAGLVAKLSAARARKRRLVYP